MDSSSFLLTSNIASNSSIIRMRAEACITTKATVNQSTLFTSTDNIRAPDWSSTSSICTSSLSNSICNMKCHAVTGMSVCPSNGIYSILKIPAACIQLQHLQMSMIYHTQFSKSPRHTLQHDQHSCPAHQPVLQNSLHKQLQIGVCLNKLDQTLYNFHMYVWDCSEHQQHQPGYKMVCCHRDSQTDQAQIQHTEHYPGRLVHFLDHRKHWRRLGHLKSCK